MTSFRKKVLLSLRNINSKSSKMAGKAIRGLATQKAKDKNLERVKVKEGRRKSPKVRRAPEPPTEIKSNNTNNNKETVEHKLSPKEQKLGSQSDNVYVNTPRMSPPKAAPRPSKLKKSITAYVPSDTSEEEVEDIEDVKNRVSNKDFDQKKWIFAGGKTKENEYISSEADESGTEKELSFSEEIEDNNEPEDVQEDEEIRNTEDEQTSVWDSER